MQLRFFSSSIKLASAMLLVGITPLAHGQSNADTVVSQHGFLGYNLSKTAETVTSQNFNKGFITQPAGLIQGLIPGLNIYPTGEPGKPFEVYSRLFTDFGQSTVRFYVVDNMPVYGSIDFLNLSDIASISYLDGGTAASVYGDRALNGAIIIKTKQPSSLLRVTYNGSGAVSYVPKLVDVYSGDEFREYAKMYSNYNLIPVGTENTSWQEAIYRTTFSHQHSVAISDEISGIPYRVSVGFMNNQGVVKTTDSKRITGAITVSPTFFNDDLSIVARLWMGRKKNTPLKFGSERTYNENIIEDAIFFNPTQPVYENNDLGGYFYNKYYNVPVYPYNPLAILEQVDRRYTINQFNQSYTASYRLPFLHDLSLSVGYADANSSNNETSVEDKRTIFNYNNGIQRTSSYLENGYTTWNISAAYKHQLDFLGADLGLIAGHSQTSFDKSGGNSLWTNDMLNLDYTYNSDSKEQSNFIRANVEVLGKYTAGINVNSGKNTFFGKDFDIASYSVSAGWNVKQESFLKEIDFVSSFNVFGSYSVSEGSPNFEYSGPISSDVKPSSVRSWQVGASSSIHGCKAVLRASYSGNRTKDMFTLIPIIFGTSSQYTLGNMGELTSSNMELMADVQLLNSLDVKWKAQAAISFASSEVKKVSDFNTLLIYGQTSIEVGHPIQSFWMRQQVYGTDGKPIEGSYVQLNANGANISSSRSIGQTVPTTLFSVSSQLTCRRWDFSFMGRAASGASVYNSIAEESYLGRTGSGLLTNIAKIGEKAGFKSRQPQSDYFVQKADYFRMEYISLGYTFGGKLRPHLSATVQNAFLITGYDGFDPETSSGYDTARYPLPRIFSVSLDLSL